MRDAPSLLSAAATEFLAGVGDIREVLGPIAAIPGAMFFIKDADYRYVLMSPAVREGIGLAAGDDPAGRTDFEIFPPLVAESFRENDRRVIERGETLLDEVHMASTRSGGTRLTYSSKWPIRDRRGSIIGLIGTNRPHESTGDPSPADETARVLPALTRMLRDYSRRLGIGELAAECGVSSSHFTRLFRQRVGVTAHQFLEKVRITEAGRQLRATGRPVAEIATGCGFYDASAFVKRFRRHTGMTPLAYRKSRRAGLAGDLAGVVRGAARPGEPRDGHPSP